MDDGTYVTVENRPAVRFERDYAYPLQQVWQAISDPDQARRRFPSTLLFEPEVGGAIRFTDDPHLADQEGVVLDYDPPRALGFSWGDSEVHITLEPFADNQCRFVLINVLAADNEAARNAAGWTVCLGEFDKVIRGEESDGPHVDTAINWQTSYDAYVRSGMPAGAIIPD